MVTTTIEEDIARDYAHGALEEAIQAGLRRMGHSGTTVRGEDLVGIDQFHVGGHQATADLAEQMGLGPGMSVLDIGSGIGGVARFLARHYGCTVVGIDLTPEYVAVAEALTRLVGPVEGVSFQVASATDLPGGAGRFDAASMLHVGMNIPDKDKLCVEVARALKPGGRFAIYDVMQVGGNQLDYPLPWASTAATSFVAEPTVYRRALEAAGFDILAERNRREFAVEFFRRVKSRQSESGPPPLGLHILMGAEAQTKIANLMRNIEIGAIAPIELICRRR